MGIHKIKILVLGADGFLGSNLVKALKDDKKYEILAFDLFPDGKARNLEGFDESLRMIQGNFLNRQDIREALRNVEYVFHYVSASTPGSSMNDPLLEVNSNIQGSVVLFEECVRAGVKRIIFSSSGGAIYGNSGDESCNEESPTNPISPYAIGKLSIEKFLEYFRVHFGLDYLILRYSNPYGPGQNIIGSQGIIPIFLNLVKENKSINIFGDGNNLRDYIYVDDAINITKNIFQKKTVYRLYNIASGEGSRINDVIEIIKKVTGKKIVIEKFPKRKVDVRKINLDNSRIKNELKYYKFLELEKGIKKTWHWIKNQ